MIIWRKVSVNVYEAKIGDILYASLEHPIERNGLEFAMVTVSNSTGVILFRKTIPVVSSEGAAKEHATTIVRDVLINALYEVDNSDKVRERE